MNTGKNGKKVRRKRVPPISVTDLYRPRSTGNIAGIVDNSAIDIRPEFHKHVIKPLLDFNSGDFDSKAKEYLRYAVNTKAGVKDVDIVKNINFQAKFDEPDDIMGNLDYFFEDLSHRKFSGEGIFNLGLMSLEKGDIIPFMVTHPNGTIVLDVRGYGHSPQATEGLIQK